MLFPGVSFLKKFNWDLKTSWNQVLLLLIFNVFDTIGKYLSSFQFYGKIFCTAVVLFRYSKNPNTECPEYNGLS